MILFDFDGVLVDSVDEPGVTGYNLVTGQTVLSRDLLPPGYLKLFRKNRYHVTPAGNFVPFVKWCLKFCESEPDRELSAEEFQKSVNLEQEPLKERTRKFYARRTEIRSVDPIAWANLVIAYEPLWGTLKKDYRDPVVLLTNRDKEATWHICKHLGIEIPREQIFSGDGGVSKADNFKIIRERFPATEYFFVDDTVDNIQLVKESLQSDPIANSFQVRLATWGYLGPEDLSRAKKSGIQTITQPELVKILTR